MVEIIKNVKNLEEALIDGYRESLSLDPEWEVTICRKGDEYILLTNHHSEHVDSSNGDTIYTFNGTSPSEIDEWADSEGWDRSVVFGESVEDDIKDAMVEAFEENGLDYIISKIQ